MDERMSECLLCGKLYKVCKLCPKTREFTPWRIDFDSPRHFQIFAIFSDLRDGRITNEEAKDQLDHLEVTSEEITGFVPVVQETFAPIMNVAKKKKVETSHVETVDDGEQDTAPEKPVKHTFRGRKK